MSFIHVRSKIDLGPIIYIRCERIFILNTVKHNHIKSYYFLL